MTGKALADPLPQAVMQSFALLLPFNGRRVEAFRLTPQFDNLCHSAFSSPFYALCLPQFHSPQDPVPLGRVLTSASSQVTIVPAGQDWPFPQRHLLQSSSKHALCLPNLSHLKLFFKLCLVFHLLCNFSNLHIFWTIIVL